MRILWISLLCCIFTAAMVRGDDANSTITIDGVIYENYHWGTITPTGITIFHQAGVATIPLEKLPPDLQERFGYDPKTAAGRASQSTPAAGNPSGQKHPAEIAGISSVSPTRVTALIVFLNESKELRRIYWLDFKGGRQRYGELKPGQRDEQQTFLGHAWLVTDSQDNALGLYYPDGQKRVVVLE
jgi:von Hippel-Lindau disease tumor suppressor protein